MIPKVIHYCWFGRGQKPEAALKCIESWKKFLPDYDLKEWNEDNFDISSNQALLHGGTNVLCILGATASLRNDEFLVNPLLEGEAAVSFVDEQQLYMLTPTPGDPNLKWRFWVVTTSFCITTPFPVLKRTAMFRPE